MTGEAKPVRAALGFRVKSGWAMAALLAGSADEPQLAICRQVLLSDPKVPRSKQPHHPALDLPEKEGTAVTKKLRSVVRKAAKRSVKEILQEAQAAQYEVRGAALVVGSLVDPATLHNEHIRAHGLEGQLFRTVLQDALQGRKISCGVYLEKGAYEAAAPVLRKSAAQAKRTISSLGESHDGSWRAEEKLAALAAWVALAEAERK
ncbi:MAG TPA: hypothetical protein VJN42_01325 [Candidatus Acidoferrum sp.]|nr:hypothetical protein [Candidatus Acidoferrum sp.]